MEMRIAHHTIQPLDRTTPRFLLPSPSCGPAPIGPIRLSSFSLVTAAAPTPPDGHCPVPTPSPARQPLSYKPLCTLDRHRARTTASTNFRPYSPSRRPPPPSAGHHGSCHVNAPSASTCRPRAPTLGSFTCPVSQQDGGPNAPARGGDGTIPKRGLSSVNTTQRDAQGEEAASCVYGAGTSGCGKGAFLPMCPSARSHVPFGRRESRRHPSREPA